MSDDKIQINYGDAGAEILEEIQRVPTEPARNPRPQDEDTAVEAYQGAQLPPEYGEQLSVADQLAEQQAALARPGANLDTKGAPHFLRNVGGEEVCGQDGQPWPCSEWRRIETGAIVAQGLDPAAQTLPTMAEAATAAGMDLAEFEERLRQARQH